MVALESFSFVEVFILKRPFSLHSTFVVHLRGHTLRAFSQMYVERATSFEKAVKQDVLTNVSNSSVLKGRIRQSVLDTSDATKRKALDVLFQLLVHLRLVSLSLAVSDVDPRGKKKKVE